jgi:hypothetical protein
MFMSKRQAALFQEFGDVLLLDATYKTSHYKLAQVHGVVIDAHGKARLVFCAVVEIESAETYTWILSNITRTTGMAARVLLVDQDPSIAKAMRTRWKLETTLMLCKFHLMNNIRKVLGDLTDEEINELREDMRFADGSKSEIGFIARLERIRENSMSHPSLGAHLQKLLENEHWAGYLRKRNQSLFFSTSQVELAHSHVKSRLDRTRSLVAAIQACLDLEDAQSENEILDVFHTLENRPADRLHPALKINIQDILDDVSRNLGRTCQAWIYEQVNLKGSLSVHQLTRSDVGLLMEGQYTRLHNLPSDQGVELCNDLPDEIVAQAGNEQNDYQFFRISEAGGVKSKMGYIDTTSYILSTSQKEGKFFCSCLVASLRGFVCAHFLACFTNSSAVYYNTCMWALRWRLHSSSFGESNPILTFNREGQQTFLTAASSECLIQALKEHHGGRPIQLPDFQVDETTVCTPTQARQALKVFEDLHEKAKVLYENKLHDQLSSQAEIASGLINDLNPPDGTLQSLLTLNPPVKTKTRGRASSQYFLNHQIPSGSSRTGRGARTRRARRGNK